MSLADHRKSFEDLEFIICVAREDPNLSVVLKLPPSRVALYAVAKTNNNPLYFHGSYESLLLTSVPENPFVSMFFRQFLYFTFKPLIRCKLWFLKYIMCYKKRNCWIGVPWTWFNKRKNCRRWVFQSLANLLDQEENITFAVVFIWILFWANNYFWYSEVKIIFIYWLNYFFVKIMRGLWWYKL